MIEESDCGVKEGLVFSVVTERRNLRKDAQRRALPAVCVRRGSPDGVMARIVLILLKPI